MTKITILCENSVGRPGNLLGEHGFAALVETGGGRWLFDTGQGFGIINNSNEIGCNLHDIDGIILSHGHNDHTGGLKLVLQTLQRPVEIVAHPDIFAPRYWKSDFELRTIGIPFTREELEALGARFRCERSPLRLGTNLLVSGEVPRRNPFEKGDPHLVVAQAAGGFEPDRFNDDLSLAIATPKGLVVLLGCAHAGVINILEHLLALSGESRIHALIGGTHLGPATEEQYAATVAALKGFRIDKIAVSHCTGLTRAAQIQRDLPGQFFFAAAGSIFDFA